MAVKRSSKLSEGKLTAGGKVKKWFRMVILLTFKKYGARILWQLLITYLLTDAVKAMHSIWSDFAEFKNCQDDYIKTISTNVSADYDEAAEALAQSVMGRAKCVMGTLDLDLPSPFPDIKIPKGFIGDIFGWFTPGKINIPRAELDIRSNTEEVVDSVFKDVNIFKVISVWTRYIGLILAFFSLIMIIFTATYYTITNKVWKPSLKSHIFRFIQFTQAMGAYIVVGVVVFLQAYATNKFCQISIDKAELKTPKCSLLDRDCNFSCELVSKEYPSHCTKCKIKLHWWWIEPFSLPNIFCVSYVAFMLIVLIYECCEATLQRREIFKARRKEREERRKKRMRYMARKIREKRAIEQQLIDEEEAAKKSAYMDQDRVDDGYNPPEGKNPPEDHRRRKRKPQEPENLPPPNVDPTDTIV